MSVHVIIDGNNLLHAMHAHAPLPQIGRETLVKIVERWAGQGDDDVTLVFDGPIPPKGLAAQMASSRITVRFSAPVTADDVIVAMIERARDPGALRVVSGDTAIRREARHRRCGHTDAASFVAELIPPEDEPQADRPEPDEKPDRVSPEEARKWADVFGVDDDNSDSFNGSDAMTQ